MHSISLTRAGVAFMVALSMSLLFATNAHASTGATFTTDSGCVGTNVNIFNAKTDVFLDGGPHHDGSTGLPDGNYYVQVTAPGGGVLGKTPTNSVVVSGGQFATCYHLMTILSTASSGFTTPGYDDTTNGGGVYKVWISKTAGFDNGTNKTDNFKVAPTTPPDPNADNGSIEGMKYNDVNANGTKDSGDDGLSGWQIDLYDSTNTLVDSTVTDGSGNYSFPSVAPDTYKICELMQADWYPSAPTTSDPNCHTGVVVGTNEVVTAKNFGNYQLPTITVVKVVNNAHGGTAVADDFMLTVDGNAVTSGVPVFVQPGSHDVGETLLDGYTLDGFSGSCTADDLTDDRAALIIDNQAKIDALKTAIADNPGAPENATRQDLIEDFEAKIDALQAAITGSATVGYGENITCTITNHDLAPNLVVVKHVVNNNGGTALASAFTMNVTGTNVSDDSFAGDESGTTVSLDAGSYSADESAMMGYAKTLSAQCSGTIALGETKTCTVTNDDIAPSLTLNKVVVNDNTGTRLPSAWMLSVTGITSISGPGAPGSTDVVSGPTFSAGTYTLAESGPAGYQTTGWSCTGVINTGNSLTIGIGQTAVCTIVNDDIPPTRTQGFWSTHTAFSSTKWTALVTPGTDDNLCSKTISATQSAGANQLMGGFLSDIAKKTVGGNRTTVEKSRMVLLQQLLAAILNKNVLGNHTADGAISTAQTAYCGSNQSQMQASTAALDAFNNSGDAAPLPSSLGNPGSATPSTSQSQANKIYWNVTI